MVEPFKTQDIITAKNYPNKSFIVTDVDTMSQPLPLYTVVDMDTREEFVSYCCEFERAIDNPWEILKNGKEVVHETASMLSKKLTILDVYIMDYKGDLYYISLKNNNNRIHTCKKLT